MKMTKRHAETTYPQGCQATEVKTSRGGLGPGGDEVTEKPQKKPFHRDSLELHFSIAADNGRTSLAPVIASCQEVKDQFSYLCNLF